MLETAREFQLLRAPKKRESFILRTINSLKKRVSQTFSSEALVASSGLESDQCDAVVSLQREREAFEKQKATER